MPLEENIEFFLQDQLEYEMANGACFVRPVRLKNKFKQDSTAVKLTFSGTFQQVVKLKGTSIAFKTETYVTPSPL